MKQRLQQRKEDYKNACFRLKEALKEEVKDIVIDGVIYRYEFTFELAWKTMKECLEYLGVIDKTGSPREVIQASFRQGIIETGDIWIEMMLARNSLSHLYDEAISRKIYDDIKNRYILEFEKLQEKCEQIL